MSQQQLAGLVHLDRTTIGALERNDYKDLGIRKYDSSLEACTKLIRQFVSQPYIAQALYDFYKLTPPNLSFVRKRRMLQ